MRVKYLVRMMMDFIYRVVPDFTEHGHLSVYIPDYTIDGGLEFMDQKNIPFRLNCFCEDNDDAIYELFTLFFGPSAYWEMCGYYFFHEMEESENKKIISEWLSINKLTTEEINDVLGLK